ncbi:hypothetical protein VFPPC_17729 [Pochonia chlamydosporia 170]|uniref:Uncharacterized protein n=1 Tax=Pochonia chlamydosporia 170 TaxID=1380566 RepID=A0A219ASA7_METCM|nr:hypothetical protein VFPPC_17729 [Pochonia chlamydosporia 170]OWT43095.1 hypothetical protein VFPPC_17729 [Pochonia chlamydosporia 170]
MCECDPHLTELQTVAYRNGQHTACKPLIFQQSVCCNQSLTETGSSRINRSEYGFEPCTGCRCFETGGSPCVEKQINGGWAHHHHNLNQDYVQNDTRRGPIRNHSFASRGVSGNVTNNVAAGTPCQICSVYPVSVRLARTLGGRVWQAEGRSSWLWKTKSLCQLTLGNTKLNTWSRQSSGENQAAICEHRGNGFIEGFGFARV